MMRLISAQLDPNKPNSIANRMRRKRSRHVMRLIEQAHREHGRCRIIDLGGELAYWRLFDRKALEDFNVHITLVNLPPMVVEDPMFAAVQGNACDLSGVFPDNSFELVHSNSVVEHVGDWQDMEQFAGEVQRLAPLYYVQTPNYGFPVEPHFSALFFHWRSEQARARALLKMRPNYGNDLGHAMRDVQSAKLLDRGQFKFLFPDCEVLSEKFFGLTKSLIGIRG
jgi:hypothetical protein